LIEQPTQNDPAEVSLPNDTSTPIETLAPDDGGKHDQGDSSLMLWFVGVSAVATGLIALFNYQLVGVTHDMKQATIDAANASRDSAEAAKESARAAKAALQIDRPLLVVEPHELKHFWPISRRIKKPVMATFVVRNHGRTVASSIAIKGRLDVVEIDFPEDGPAVLPERQYPRIGNHFRCKSLNAREQAVAPNSTSSAYQIFLSEGGIPHPETSVLSDEIFANLVSEFGDFLSGKMQDKPLVITLHVVIEYPSPGSVESFISESVWEYVPSRADADSSGKFVLTKFSK
ncbi:MAG: hypothetical protein ACREQC_02655, partial [Candidatus Binataceae bacterium]